VYRSSTSEYGRCPPCTEPQCMASCLALASGLASPPLRDFEQLVEGPWPILTSCPPGGLWARGSAFWRENWSTHPPFRAQISAQLVEDPIHFFRNFRPPALTFRPVDELASPARVAPCTEPQCRACIGVKSPSVQEHVAWRRRPPELSTV
jgi:hypothetical protein